MKSPVKIIILFCYLTYLASAIWGCINLKEGLKLQNLAPDDSYVIPAIDTLDKYFKVDYGPKVQLVFTETLDYSDATVRSNVFQQLQSFRDSSFFYSDDLYFEASQFLYYLQETSQPVPDNMTSFIRILETEFLIIPQYNKFTLDLKFNEDQTKIIASRFLIQARKTVTTSDERYLMEESRSLAKKGMYEMTSYYMLYIFFDQYIVILGNTLQNLGIAIACMLGVALILLPSLITTLWVTLSVVSITVGVIGFMTIWQVNLDSVSMINLIMCIGFSVDFSAHISYHFCISKEKTGNAKAIDALANLGTPITQGALSTIFGVVVLATSNSYILRTFFKIMFLVMVFGFMHAMFILPVVLSLIGPQTQCKIGRNDNKREETMKGDINEKPQIEPPEKAYYVNHGYYKDRSLTRGNSTIYSGMGNGPPYISTIDIRT